MNNLWTERYYVCSKCDASITIASDREPKRHPMCECSSTKTTLISVTKLERAS